MEGVPRTGPLGRITVSVLKVIIASHLQELPESNVEEASVGQVFNLKQRQVVFSVQGQPALPREFQDIQGYI